MGDQTTDRADRRRDAAPAESAPGEPRGLRDRILGEAPTVFVTLVSVLVGLVLTDLVTEARARMHLWPLNLRAILTWTQLIATSTAAVSVWMVIAHLGITRRRTPQLSEGIACLGPPLLLLTANTFVGREQAWPWFYGAGVYLVACALAYAVLVRQAMDQPGGGTLRPNAASRRLSSDPRRRRADLSGDRLS